MLASEKELGLDHPETQQIYNELATVFSVFKFVPRLFEELVARMRRMLETVRQHEKAIMALCVQKGKMPRQLFVTTFPGHEVDKQWLEKTH